MMRLYLIFRLRLLSKESLLKGKLNLDRTTIGRMRMPKEGVMI